MTIYPNLSIPFTWDFITLYFPLKPLVYFGHCRKAQRSSYCILGGLTPSLFSLLFKTSLAVHSIRLNSKTDIKNGMTRWANKKPFSDITLLLEHRVKTIFVSTRRTDLKLIFHLNNYNFVIHTTLLIKTFLWDVVEFVE